MKFLQTFYLFTLVNYIYSLSTDDIFCATKQINISCDIYHNSVKELCLNHSTSSCFSRNLRQVNDNYLVDFIKFIKEHNKIYESIEEIYERFYIFKDNAIFSFNENNKNNSYTLGINNFADLTNVEYKEIYLNNFKKPYKNYCTDKFLIGVLPKNIDWVEKGALPPVKDQGQCGSCWAFSTVGALESLHFIQTGILQQFSEQQLVSCSQNYQNMGCNGGIMQNAFSYVIDNGINTEKEYPYFSGNTEETGTCQKLNDKKYKINKCYNIESNEYQLTQFISLQPVSVSIEADSRSFQLYKSGVYDDKNCGTNLDHAVLAVGFGTLNGKDYYKVRNSWSDKWGDKGYIYIARNSVVTSNEGICGIAKDASVPN